MSVVPEVNEHLLGGKEDSAAKLKKTLCWKEEGKHRRTLWKISGPVWKSM
jgi:hypothetical protein